MDNHSSTRLESRKPTASHSGEPALGQKSAQGSASASTRTEPGASGGTCSPSGPARSQVNVVDFGAFLSPPRVNTSNPSDPGLAIDAEGWTNSARQPTNSTSKDPIGTGAAPAHGRKEAVGKALLESLQTIGFVVLVNHPIPKEDIDEMFEWTKRLFALPLEIKQLAPHPESGAHHRGYSAVGRESARHYKTDNPEAEGHLNITTDDADVIRDYKESFEVGREDDPLMPNIWFPRTESEEEILPGFKEACLKYYWVCYETEKTLLRALALGLSLPEDYFLPLHSMADNQLRLLHYPSIPRSVLENEHASRIPSHADYGSLTMLVQDDIGGLEVEDPQRPGTYIPVPTIPGSLVVNAGDFLMRWSNDTIRSTVHRVRSPPLSGSGITGTTNCGAGNIDDGDDDMAGSPQQEWMGSSSFQSSGINKGNRPGMVPARYSIPYFCTPDLDTVVDCIPGTWSDSNPKKYEPISAKNYVLRRLALNYQK